ncbi:MAG: hypothetical protein JJU00_00050 [Opitutales bacterium]|nr:hypothetical protein [Opitutales bacterium]
MKSLLPITLALAAATVAAANAEHPVILETDIQPNTNADGGLRWAVGTHNIQTYRANRTTPTHADGLNHTYLHAANLAYWNGRFYLHYLSAPVSEHETPTDTSVMTSEDGVHWDDPRLIFPAMTLPDGSQTLTHQRMGFYVAPDGRLLSLAFHGEAPSPNNGEGIGRVVREIYEDGSFGPIYFIRYNSHPGWDPAKAAEYPFYKDSPDEGFVAACDALLEDKLTTAQWWEEDRSEDGFYTVSGRALSWFRQPEGRVVGIWKGAQISYTDDEGQSWERPGAAPGFWRNGSKYWAQETSDGRFAIVFNPTSRLRHPLAVTLSEDGSRFTDLLSIHGELPHQRFPGYYKNMGPQYVRGIVPGNGEPPDGKFWVAYSVNKEDMWVSRVPVPVTADVPAGDLMEDFEDTAVGDMPQGWNVYRPLWAPVDVVDTGSPQGRALRLRDEDPYDYASATRVFAPRRSVLIRFRLFAEQTDGRFEIDVNSGDGLRPVQIALTEEGRVIARHEGMWKPAGTYEAGRWIDFELDVNPGGNTERFQLRVDGEEVLYRIAYVTDYPSTVERLTFRTGEYRRRPASGPDDMPGADDKTPLKTFLIDDVSIELRSDD